MDWFDRYDLDPPPAPEGCPATPREAVATLAAGNARFVAMRHLAAAADDRGETICTCQTSVILEAVSSVGTVDVQAPFCAVLGCSDARVPLEILFDTGPNRLFVVRVAGNVPGDECLGSIEYAARTFQSTVQIVAVVGHTGCGAVGAAVTSYLNPKSYTEIAFSRSLRAVVNHVLVAVRSAALSLEQVWGPDVARDDGYPQALGVLSVYMNAGITAYQLARELGLGADRPDVVFGVYDLASSKVGFPADPNGYTTKLAPAPADPNQLVELGRTLAASNPVRLHLHGRRMRAVS